MNFSLLYSYNQKENYFSIYFQEMCPLKDLATNLEIVEGVNKALTHYQVYLLSYYAITTTALQKVDFQRSGASL